VGAKWPVEGFTDFGLLSVARTHGKQKKTYGKPAYGNVQKMHVARFWTPESNGGPEGPPDIVSEKAFIVIRGIGHSLSRNVLRDKGLAAFR
jgi:hypothetical protein